MIYLETLTWIQPKPFLHLKCLKNGLKICGKMYIEIFSMVIEDYLDAEFMCLSITIVDKSKHPHGILNKSQRKKLGLRTLTSKPKCKTNISTPILPIHLFFIITQKISHTIEYYNIFMRISIKLDIMQEVDLSCKP